MSVTYCTDTDIVQRVGEYILTRWTGKTGEGTYNPAIVAFHRQRSCDIINARLASRFDQYLPFTGADIPPVLRSIEIDVTVYALATTYEQAGEAYQQAYKDAMKLLEDIAFGRVALMSNGVNLTDGAVITDGLAMSTTAGQTPIFSRATLGYQMARRF